MLWPVKSFEGQAVTVAVILRFPLSVCGEGAAFKGRYLVFPLTPAPSPRKEGVSRSARAGKNGSGSPSLFTGEGFGVEDTAARFNIPTPISSIPQPLSPTQAGGKGSQRF